MSVQDAIKSLRKSVPAAFEWGENFRTTVQAVSTGSIAVDDITGIKGFPRGRISEVFGWEGCVSFTTQVGFTVVGPTQTVRPRHGGTELRVRNCKGGTIERLYERFHGIQSKKGRPALFDGETYYLPSVNAEDRVFLNRVVDVVQTGSRPCLVVKTTGGHTLTATDEHKMYTGVGFTALGGMRPGDAVMVHANTPYSGGDGRSQGRKYFYVKHHPVAGVKVVRDVRRGYANAYHWLLRSRAVIEAEMNGLTVDHYVARLNSDREKDWVGLKYLPREMHVHHQDENIQNDSLNNLLVMPGISHNQMHAGEDHNNLRYEARPDTIASIQSAGTQRTYDVRMLSPHNNYVAGGLVVHNSGKTILCMTACAAVQRQGGVAVYIDVEQGMDLALAKKIGFDYENDQSGIYLCPNTFEETVKIVDAFAKSDEADLVVVDSVPAMVPESEMEGKIEDGGQIAAKARMLATSLPRLTKHLNRTALVFVNQMRMNVDTTFAGKYAPKERSSGGSALRFFSSLRLDLKQKTKAVTKTKVTDRYTGKEVEIATSSLHEAEAFKNKMATPYRRAAFYIRFDEERNLWGIDNLQTVCDIALSDGVVLRKGAYYSFVEGDLNFNVNGEEAYYDFMRNNPEVQAAVMKRLNL